MSTDKRPFRINVGFLINQPVGTSRDFHFEFEQIHLNPDLDLSTLDGNARVGRTPQGLLVQGDFKASTSAECVRCLVPCVSCLETSFSELYAFKASGMTDANLRLPESGIINLENVLREYLVLEIPIQPLCKSDCKGLCISCGADLNNESCEHHMGIKI